MSNEYVEFIEETLDKLKRTLARYRSEGNLVNEAKLCLIIAGKYSELTGHKSTCQSTFLDKNGKMAKSYYRAVIEIAKSIDSKEIHAEGFGGLADLYYNLGILKKALICYTAQWDICSTEDVEDSLSLLKIKAALGLGNVRTKMALESQCKLVFSFNLNEALTHYQSGLLEKRQITDVESYRLRVQLNLAIAKIHHHLNMESFNWDECHEHISSASIYVKDNDWLSLCWLHASKVMLAEQRCIESGKRPFDARRQVECSSWNDILPSLDEHLVIAKRIFDHIRECQSDKKSPSIPNVKLANMCLVVNQVALAYLNLTCAHEAIGDFELAYTTACVFKDFCKSFVADPQWVRDAESKVSSILKKQRAFELVNVERSIYVNIEEAVSSYTLLGMYEMACDLLLSRISEWEYKQNGRKLVYAYRQLVTLYGKLKQPTDPIRPYHQKLLTLLPETDPDKISILIALYEKSPDDDLYATDAHRLIQSFAPKQVDFELALLSKRYFVTGNFVYKDQCLSLYAMLSNQGCVSSSDEGCTESSYFANRKPSKTLQKLVDKNMVMKSRKRGQGLNLKVKKRPTLKRSLYKHSNSIKYKDRDDDSFIIDSDQESIKDTFLSPNLNDQEKVLVRSSRVESQDNEDNDTFSVDYNHDQDIDEPHDKIIINNANPSFTYTPKHVRVLVTCGPYQLLIPCIDDDITVRKTISWLSLEIKRRCYELYSTSPEITKLLSDGIILFGEDAVTDILLDNQRVECVINSWQNASISEQYQRACENVSVPTCNGVLIKRLGNSSDGRVSLSFLDLSYSHEHCKALFSCLNNVTFLDLSENLLDDRALRLLAHFLADKNTLKHLDVSGNRIRGQALVELVQALPFLEYFDISFNPIDEGCIIHLKQVFINGTLKHDYFSYNHNSIG